MTRSSYKESLNVRSLGTAATDKLTFYKKKLDPAVVS